MDGLLHATLLQAIYLALCPLTWMLRRVAVTLSTEHPDRSPPSMPRTVLFMASIRQLLFGVLFCCCGVAARAQMPSDISRGELARLPPYCPYTISWTIGGFPEGPLPQQRPWVQRLGEGFWATHHYCWALINASRAKHAGVTTAQRDHLYTKALDDVNYMLTNTPSDFPLRPELHVKAGDYLIELRRPAAAAEHFDRAASIKPDYWPAYTRKAELYMSLSLWQRAREAVESGLSVLPADPRLLALADRLARRGLPVQPRPRGTPDSTAPTESTVPAPSPSAPSGPVANGAGALP